jgi:hypothetical protein
MKTVVLCLLGSVLCAACSQGPEPTLDDSVIMPTNVDNVWVGKRTSRLDRDVYDTLRITSTVGSSIGAWFQFSTSNDRYPRPDGIGGYAMQNRADGLYVQRDQSSTAPSSVSRAIKYPVKIGDTIIDNGWFQQTFENGSQGGRLHDFAVVARINESVTVPAGTFNAFKVEFRTALDSSYIGEALAPEFDVAYVAPGVGLVKAERNDGTASWVLVDAQLK